MQATITHSSHGTSSSLTTGAFPGRKIPVVQAMTLRTWLLLVLLSVLWGSGTFFNRVAVQDVGPMTVVALRVGLAVVVLWLVMRLRSIPVGWSREDWVPYTVMGVLNTTVPFTLIALGLMRIDSGLAGILLATTPLFTMLVARVARSAERLNRVRVLGVLVGVVGVVVIMGEHLGSVAAGSGLAKLAILGAALAYGISGVYGASLRDHELLSLAWGQLCVSTVLLAPIAILWERPFDSGGWSLEATVSILALALLSTALRYLVFYRLLAEVGATSTSMVGFLIPASSLVLGCLFLDERFHVSQVVGMVLVTASLIAVNGGFQREPERASEGNRAETRASSGAPPEPGVKWG